MIFFANGRCSVLILSRPIFVLGTAWESLSSLSFAQARLRTCTARGEGGREDSTYERGGDARLLAEGCKFRILVSLRVFWAKRHHILP